MGKREIERSNIRIGAMTHSVKKRLFEILEVAGEHDLASRCIDLFIMTLILCNVFAVILSTVSSIEGRLSGFFHGFEIFSIVVFTLEYLLRLWSCTADVRYQRSTLGRIKFALSPLALIDLFAILPFYIPLIIRVDLRILRVLRLFRLFRLFKLSRYSEALKSMGSVLAAKKEELFNTAFVVIILLIFASSLMYLVEHEVQPKLFSSIPAAMWWGVATLTSVGYGDIYPVTHVGKFLGAIIAILGIGLFALPAGILASGFAEEIQRRHAVEKLCPHCGNTLEPK